MRASFRVAKQLATARLAEVASGMDLQQAPQLSEEQIAEDRAKKKSGVGKFLFGIGAVSSLDSFPLPQAACSHDHVVLGCLPGPLSLGTVRAAVPLCSLGALRDRLFLVPCGASCLDALRGWLLVRPPGPLVS